MNRSHMMFPKLRATAAIEPSTLDAESRTVEVRFYSGAEVLRVPIFDDPYQLAFSLDPKAVRLDRFNAGAPVVDNHMAGHGSVKSDVLGVVEKAWLEADGGHARVRFSARDDVKPVLQDIKDGILRNFSMGAVVHQMRDVTEKGDEMRRLLAIDWEPMELSIVPVPADPGAQALASAERFPCQLTGASAPEERSEMEKIKVRLLASGEIVEIEESEFDETLHSKDIEDIDPKAATRAVEDSIEKDKAYAKEVRRLAAHHNLDEVWTQWHIKLRTPILQVINDALEARKKHAHGQNPTNGMISMSEDFEAIGWKVERMAEAVLARAQRKEPPDAARIYAQHSIADCAFECLAMNGRTRGRNLDSRRAPEQVINLALHTTSDFPGLLENILNKALLPEYQAATPTYRMIATRRTFRDFRPHRFVRSGDFPLPLLVNEHGEFKHGTMGESSETVSLATYGRILGITRQVLINDDVGAFQDFAARIARRLTDFENATFFTNVILAGAGLGPALADTNTVYHALHLNVTGAGTLDNTRLGAAYALLLNQTSIDGLKLNVPPRYLLVSPTNYINARQLTTAVMAQTAAAVNIFAGMLEPIADANLTGTRFYVLADPAVLPQYVYGNLEGQGGPRIDVRVGFEIDGVETKVALDFGCGAIEYRGGVTGAGA